jgi:hypothetical protein
MSERKYSVSELRALRMAVEHKWLWGAYGCGAYQECSRQYQAEEKWKAVEEMVRTHMRAGHTAEDLYASERRPTDTEKGTA